MILLDGVDLYEQFGLVVQKGHSNPLAPQTRDAFIDVAGNHGAIDFPAYLDKKTFNIPMAFVGEHTDHDLQNKISEFAKFLLDDFGRPRQMQLVFQYDIDKFYTVRYSGKIDMQRYFSLGFFTLPLVATDPFMYLKEYADAYTLDSGIAIDNTISPDDKYEFDITTNTTVSVNNFGKMYVEPIIEITGSFTTLSITANGKTLVYDQSLTADTLIIDNAKMTAKLADGTNKLGNISGDFIQLLEGYNDITISGSGMNFNIYFKFRPRFI